MPVRLITLSTDTGTFPSSGYVDFGDAYQFATFKGGSTAVDKDIAATVQGTLGHSGKWVTLLTITTNSSDTTFNTVVPATGADVVLFDKARLVVTKNNATESLGFWIAAK